MAKYSRAGANRAGYCKLCSFDNPIDQDEFDKRTGLKKSNGKHKYSSTDLNNWLTDHELSVVDPRTIYNHREHVEHPRDRVVNAIAKRRAERGVQPASSSHEEFLQSLVAIGQDRIAANPEDVTIDQALKAAQLQVQREKKGQTQNVLVQIFTQGSEEPDVIEGEVTEV